MKRLNPIINETGETIGYHFYCPGCESYHAPYIRPHKSPNGSSWDFNGDMEKPTFNPSIVTRVDFNEINRFPKICHLFVRDGMIQYLSDSTHKLAGKTVEMEEV